MAAGFHIKRQVFLSIRATSQMDTHILTGISKITLQYFSMAELTGFATAYDYIVNKNPILLSWNGLGKYTPYLLAAINAFRKMGEDGPYCKFLYPSEKLGASHGSKIGIFTAVAAEISILEGHQNFANYQGVVRSDITKGLAQKCAEIVTAFGGATTISTKALRDEHLIDLDQQPRIKDALNSCIDELTMTIDEGPSKPN